MNISAFTDTLIATVIIYLPYFSEKKTPKPCRQEFYLASADKTYRAGT